MRLIDADKLVAVTLTDGGYWTKEVYYKADIDAAPTVYPPPNDPLTLEQLREMDGEPVWVECLGNKDYSVWAIIDFCLNGIHTKYFYDDFDYYGTEWLAYRRKPEEGRT